MKRWNVRDGAHFVTDAFKFTKELLRMDRPDHFFRSKEEVDQYLRKPIFDVDELDDDT